MGMKLWRNNLVWFALYCGLLVAVFLVMRQARSRAIAKLGTEEAQSGWQEWRDEAQRQAEGAGPVSRRVPKTGQPPELVLLRDHFGVSLLGIVLLTTAIFLTFMLFARGVRSGSRFPLQEDQPAGG